MNKYIQTADDLVTSHEETRAGFIAFALEKNRRSAPHIEEAKTLRILASEAKSPRGLLSIDKIEKALLTAAGLSDKSLKYFQKEDRIRAIKELVTNFLEPAGDDFVDEVVYRFLLTKGDTLGGSMRNIVGSLGQQKFVRGVLSVLNVFDIPYVWLSSDKKAQWAESPEEQASVSYNLKALSWQFEGESKVLAFNLKNPLIQKNIDICLFEGTPEAYTNGSMASEISKTIALGELKSGIDPAGADEHWKTASSALKRIRDAFRTKEHPIKTLFIGAAIEKAMAVEIFDHLKSGELSNAANLSSEQQLVDVCTWIVTLKSEIDS